MNWFLDVLQKRYATFTGRARRAEYWNFVLFYILIFMGLSVVDFFIGIFSFGQGIGILGGLFALGMLVPSIAVTVRRLHDTDRSGWWILIGAIPFFGGLILLVFMCLSGTPGDNRFGSDPIGFIPRSPA